MLVHRGPQVFLTAAQLKDPDTRWTGTGQRDESGTQGGQAEYRLQLAWDLDQDPLAPLVLKTSQIARCSLQCWPAQQLEVRSQTTFQTLSTSSVPHSQSAEEQPSLQHRADGLVAERLSDSLPKAGPQGLHPNASGFVPAYITGNVFLCKVPLSGKGNRRDIDTNLYGLDLASAAQSLSGPFGLFASEEEAKLAAKDLGEQQPLQDNTIGRPNKGLGIEKLRAPDRKDVHALTRAREEVQKALSAAESRLHDLNRAADAIWLKEYSVMPVALGVALNLVVNRPEKLRLVSLGKKDSLTQQASGPWAGDKGLQHAVEAGMPTYSIRGISFTMPTTAGPLNFSPIFTSKRTAKLSWEALQEVLVTHEVCRRKSQRELQRAATIVGAASLTGIKSKFEAVEGNEDEEGLAEPAEVKEFMQEMGETDDRPGKSKVKMQFKPQSPLDLVALCACGIISLYAHGLEHLSNTVDSAYLHSFGKQALHVAGAAAITQQPMHSAVADVQQWNERLRLDVIHARQRVHRIRPHVVTYLGGDQLKEEDEKAASGAANGEGIRHQGGAQDLPSTAAQQAASHQQGQCGVTDAQQDVKPAQHAQHVSSIAQGGPRTHSSEPRQGASQVAESSSDAEKEDEHSAHQKQPAQRKATQQQSSSEAQRAQHGESRSAAPAHSPQNIEQHAQSSEQDNSAQGISNAAQHSAQHAQRADKAGANDTGSPQGQSSQQQPPPTKLSSAFVKTWSRLRLRPDNRSQQPASSQHGTSGGAGAEATAEEAKQAQHAQRPKQAQGPLDQKAVAKNEALPKVGVAAAEQQPDPKHTSHQQQQQQQQQTSANNDPLLKALAEIVQQVQANRATQQQEAPRQNEAAPKVTAQPDQHAQQNAQEAQQPPEQQQQQQHPATLAQQYSPQDAQQAQQQPQQAQQQPQQAQQQPQQAQQHPQQAQDAPQMPDPWTKPQQQPGLHKLAPDRHLSAAEQEAADERQASLQGQLMPLLSQGFQLDHVFMPPQFPNMDNLKCLTNDGSTDMLTAVRGLFYGLVYETGMDRQGESKLLRGGQVPIMPVPDGEGDMNIDQILNPPLTHWQFDVPMITGRRRSGSKKKRAAQEEEEASRRSKVNIQGKGLVLIGDMGFGDCKSGREWMHRPHRYLQLDVGFGNLSPLTGVLQQNS